MRKYLKIFTLFLTTFLLLAGCGSSSTSSSRPADKKNNTSSNQQSSDSTQNNGNSSVPATTQNGNTTTGQSGQTDTTTEEKKTSSDSNSDSTPQQVSKKAEYLQKLSVLDKEVTKIESTNKNQTQADLNQTQDQVYKLWDNMLNDIYTELKVELQTNEMNQLGIEERTWIAQRDASAKKESAQYQGGTIYTMQYESVLTRLTRERCYALVNKYMK